MVEIILGQEEVNENILVPDHHFAVTSRFNEDKKKDYNAVWKVVTNATPLYISDYYSFFFLFSPLVFYLIRKSFTHSQTKSLDYLYLISPHFTSHLIHF